MEKEEEEDVEAGEWLVTCARTHRAERERK